MESDRKKVWTIPRVQGAVKAAFFLRALQDRQDEFEIELRYRDLKTTLALTEGAVSDRTLSRALSGLVSTGHLNKEGSGKKTRYRILIPRSEVIGAYAKSDGTSIVAGSQIGAVGRIDEGWAFYGVPEPLANRIRPILRREAATFRDRMSAVIEDFAIIVIRRIVGQARGRLSRAEIRAGEEGLWRLIEQSTILAMLSFGGGRFWNWIEQTHPGALKVARRGMGLDSGAGYGREATVDDLVRAWTFITGVPAATMRLSIERQVRAMRPHVEAANRLLQILPPARRAKALKELGNLAPLGGAMTAVIHHL